MVQELIEAAICKHFAVTLGIDIHRGDWLDILRREFEARRWALPRSFSAAKHPLDEGDVAA